MCFAQVPHCRALGQWLPELKSSILGYPLYGSMGTYSVPQSESTSMPLSCNEPGEEAVQLPHSKSTNTTHQPYPSNPVPLTVVEANPAATATLKSATLPSHPSTPAPRFRLELPQFSTFTRKKRDGFDLDSVVIQEKGIPFIIIFLPSS